MPGYRNLQGAERIFDGEARGGASQGRLGASMSRVRKRKYSPLEKKARKEWDLGASSKIKSETEAYLGPKVN
jgi:hypothetical protein